MPITFSLANEVFLRTTQGQSIALDQLRSAAAQGGKSTHSGKKIADAVKGGISKLASPARNTKNMLFVRYSIQGCYPSGVTYQELLLMLDGSHYLVKVNRPEARPATDPKYVGQSIKDNWNLESVRTLTAVAADKILEAVNKANATYAAEKRTAGLEAQALAPPAAINTVNNPSSSPPPTQLNRGLANQISQVTEVYQCQ